MRKATPVGRHASTPEELIDAVRVAVASGEVPLVAPDELCVVDGVIDQDTWLALVSVLVSEGAAHIATDNPREANRILAMHQTIQAADISVIEAAT